MPIARLTPPVSAAATQTPLNDTLKSAKINPKNAESVRSAGNGGWAATTN